MHPAITDTIAEKSTAPAAVSLASFARGFFSSVTRSTTASIAVFTSSSDATSAKSSRQTHHSDAVI